MDLVGGFFGGNGLRIAGDVGFELDEEGMPRMRGPPQVFRLNYRCFSSFFLPPSTRNIITHSSKLIMPPSTLERLEMLKIDFPFVFSIRSLQEQQRQQPPAVSSGAPTNEGVSDPRKSHAGVLEFTAEEGRVYAPPWLMRSLAITDGDIVTVESVKLPLGAFVKIEPQSVDFLNIHDPRAVLENAFRSYSTLTRGDTITFMYDEKRYEIKLLEVRPADAVLILETDLEVDFAPPVGYVEPDYLAFSSSAASSGLRGTALSQQALSASASGTTSSSTASTNNSGGTLAQSELYGSMRSQVLARVMNAASTSSSSSMHAHAGTRLGTRPRRTLNTSSGANPAPNTSLNSYSDSGSQLANSSQAPPQGTPSQSLDTLLRAENAYELALPIGTLYFGYPVSPPDASAGASASSSPQPPKPPTSPRTLPPFTASSGQRLG